MLTLFSLFWLTGNHIHHLRIPLYIIYRLHVYCSFSLLLGVCLGVEVHQTPSEVFRTRGDEVQLVCSHGKTDYTFMQWYQKSPGDQALKRIGHLNYNNKEHEESFKTHFNITGDLSGSKPKNASMFIVDLKPEHSAVYYCAASYQFISVNNYDPAYFGSGTKLTVLENRESTPPQEVKILGPSEHECRNSKDKKRKKTLVCVASGFYPDHVEVYWQMNEKNVTDGVATDEAAERIETPPVSYRITSRLRVSAKDWYTEGQNFTCIVSFYNGKNNTKYSFTKLGVEEKYLKITNNAKLSYAVFIFKSCLYGAFVGFLVWRLQVC
uniref:Ig-like domain-containing protein n=1 Tax=Neolamprologus brichardi TaxID=32507 RepID=A0A3Q4M9V4_NEOBR